MLRLKQACFCVDLAIAAEIVGWLGLVGGALYMTNNNSQFHNSVTSFNHGNPMRQVVAGIIKIAVSICLIYGARKKNKSLLLPWIILQSIGIFAINVLFVFLSFQLSLIEAQRLMAILLIIDLLSGYFMMIVVSLYFEIKQNAKEVDYNNFSNTTLTPSEKKQEIV